MGSEHLSSCNSGKNMNNKNSKGRFFALFPNNHEIVLYAYAAMSVVLLGQYHYWSAYLGGVSLSSGEWLNRIVYYYDGMKLLRMNPFGLGHSGWWYAQTSIQSALYNVRQIHNWVLQLAMDAGIVPAMLLAACVLMVVFHKKSTLRSKLLVLLIFGHSLIDYSLAFLPITYIAVLTLPIGRTARIVNRKSTIAITVTCASMLLVLLWLGTATLLSFIGKDIAATKLYPVYTEAMEKIIIKESDPEEALIWADRILALNPYVYDAYDVKARVYASKGLCSEAVEMKHEVIQISRMHGSDYDELLMYIHFALIDADANGNIHESRALVDLALSIPSVLDAVNATLNPLAYKIRHQPTLYLSEESHRFLRYLHEYIDQLHNAGTRLGDA